MIEIVLVMAGAMTVLYGNARVDVTKDNLDDYDF